METKYIGNGTYCWENAVAMLLSSIKETVSPSYLQAVSGCGLSAFYDKRTSWLYFNFALPNEELTYDLKKLGFELKEVIISKKEATPIQKLIDELKISPVVVGPVNMGLLKYNPNSRFLMGSDHFILLYGSNRNGFFLHDPVGYPSVFITFKEFEECWKSEDIFYGNSEYRYWAQPRRIGKPTKKEIFSQTLKDFKSIYNNCDTKTVINDWVTGSTAIIKEADRFDTNDFTKGDIEFLTYYSFPTATMHALDLVDFLKPYQKKLAKIKQQYASELGTAHVYTMTKRWKLVARTLRNIAIMENEFKEQILDI